MNIRLFSTLSLFLLFMAGSVSAQNFYENASVGGSMQFDGQYYIADESLGIDTSTVKNKRYGINAFGDITYSVGNFTAGMRFEAFTPPLNGFDEKAKGYGIPYFFANYSNKYIDVTLGDFYEQFGSGLVFRSYQEWNLGYDNAVRGAKIVVKPYDGIKLTALTGYQRWYWDQHVNWNNYDRGLVTGINGDFYLNDIFKFSGETQITVGGSFVTKHETDLNKTTFINDTLYQLNLPENVAAASGRVSISRGGFGISGEYAYKINNPSAYNGYIYHPGKAMYLTTSYSTKGFGITLAAKTVDNMSFKSKMTTTNNALDISFIPPLSKQHHYSLPSMYPYASQLNGETSFKANVIYSIPRNSALGGKYGMSIEADFVIVYDLKKTPVNDNTPIGAEGTLGYDSKLFSIGENNLYRDFNLTITKKFNKTWKSSFTYVNLLYDKDRVEGHVLGEYGKVNANIGIADVTCKINSNNTIRLELQGLFVKKNQDKGNWATTTIEYSFLHNWFVSVMDEWNYGNANKNERLHYYYASCGFVRNATRISLSYGRQREGLLCVGGVCRYVPAATGLSLSFSTAF